jgi:UTP--glucose-1-phosphate uridylyltransferase
MMLIMTVKKAVITSAGFGTRFLPISKTVQKEMLPILNRPMIDYVVRDCVLAGIKEIIFVVKENELGLVQHFYSESPLLKKHLKRMGKSTSLESENIYQGVNFNFVKQSFNEKYGTAIPVLLAEKYLLGEEAFLVFMGDDFIFDPKTPSQAKKMIDLFEISHAQGLVTCISKPESELFRYGVAETKNENGFEYLTNLIEKPASGTAPSNLINISKYIFTPEVFDIIKNQDPDQKSGEYYITDTATTLAKDNLVVIFEPEGKYLDGGNVLNWLKANLVVASSQPDLFRELEKFIKEELHNS